LLNTNRLINLNTHSYILINLNACVNILWFLAIYSFSRDIVSVKQVYKRKVWSREFGSMVLRMLAVREYPVTETYNISDY